MHEIVACWIKFSSYLEEVTCSNLEYIIFSSMLMTLMILQQQRVETQGIIKALVA